MPSLAVPSRRRRTEDSDDDESSSRISGQDTPASRTSNGSKRIRLESSAEDIQDEQDGTSEDDGDDDVGTSSASSQPRDKDVSANSTSRTNGSVIAPKPSDTHDGPGFKPGAIVRIKLTDFVTYTSAEFFPGPRLNMVIGPNGTGKSTLVCAICLGLGWGPQHLGRAKDPGEFVKHGCREATIEVELWGPPRFRRNPVISRTIKREGNKSTFTINGQQASRSQVLKLAQSFSIQIDNLCQFLPQDKVSEFAALSPVELLHSTQRAAAGPEMVEWHEDLKKLRAEQKKLQADIRADQDLVANLENRQELQRADVESMRQRATIKRRIEMLELARPIPRYKDHHTVFQAAKRRRDELEQEHEELKAQLEPALRAVNAKQDYCLRLDEVVKYKKRLVEKADAAATEIGKRMEQHEDSLRDLNGQVEAEKKNSSSYRQEAIKVQQDINALQRKKEDPVTFDLELYNEKIRDKKLELRGLLDKAEELKATRNPLVETLNEKTQRVRQAQRQLENLDSQAGQQEEKLKRFSPDSYRAYRWVLENQDKFEHEVFGPPIVTCSIKDPKYADAIESLFQRTDLTAFTTQSRNDFRTLQRALNVEQKLHDISIRTCSISLSSLQPPLSGDQLRRLGFDGWATDFLLGPEPVLAILSSENRLHQTPITLRDISDEEFTRMESSPLGSWVSGKQSYQVIRRREYGPGATSTRVRQIKPAKIWTDQPIDASVKEELQQRIHEWEGEIQEIKGKMQTDKAELTRLENIFKEKDKEREKLENQKKIDQAAFTEFKGIPEKLEQRNAKRRHIEKHLADMKNRVLEIRNKQDHIAIEKAETAIEYANAVEKLRRLHEDLILVELQHIEGLSDFEALRDRNSEVKETLEAKRAEVKEAMRNLKTTSEMGRKLLQEAERVVRISNEQPDLKELLPTLSNHTMDQLDADIDSEKARLELTHEGSASLIKEFEDRERQIQRLRGKLEDHQKSLADYEHAINEIRGKWEPKLHALVRRISDAFSDSFARIGCAGQVSVDKAEDPTAAEGESKDSDFDQWSIQIQVKFREHENLSILDSHRQSGGERAVSTIFYLMALQSLSASPFRVVDEINQGMDPRNERMVHERMVDIACASSESDNDNVGGGGGSQYFLITPKLLSGLVYKPGMKVLCIVSGEHMPEDYTLVDFGRAVRRMREIAGSDSSRKSKGKGKAAGSSHETARWNTGVDVRA
ncbi:Structural maintenance of chromosomes protein 5 [Paecilomyces lecythidis]